MDLTQVLLIIHIAAAGAWLGTNIVQGVTPRLIAGYGEAPTAAWFRVTSVFAKRIYMPAAIVLLITGVWMVLRIEAFSFGSRFVTVGFSMIVIGAILGIVVFGPGGEAAADAVESGDQSAIKKATAKLATWGTVDTVLMLLTIAAMAIAWR